MENSETPTKKEYSYKEARKAIIFYIEDDTHARLKIQLKYDLMTQTAFINHIIKGYLENNKHIRDYMDDILKQKLAKTKIKIRQKDREKEEQVIKDFALDENEIENIFDILESENPEI